MPCAEMIGGGQILTVGSVNVICCPDGRVNSVCLAGGSEHAPFSPQQREGRMASSCVREE